MDGCSSMAQWRNIYHQHGLETSRSMSMILDPLNEELHQEDNSHHQGMGAAGIILPWGEGAHSRDQMCSSLPLVSPLTGLMSSNIAQAQPFDASMNKGTSSANSIDQQPLECLLSGTNSNTDTSVEDDDGISMIFSDCRNFLNFSTTHPTNNDNNNINDDGIKKRSNVESNIEGDNQEFPPFSITQDTSRSPSLRPNKRKRINNNNNNNVEKLGQAGRLAGSSNISFQLQGSSSGSSIEEPDAEAIQQMKEMIYRAAAFRPVNFGLDMVERPKRKNVRISSDPQTVAARQRRERISERLRVLQKLVPGGSKMDTASMLDEAANYLKFLRNQVKALETLSNNKVDHYQFSLNTSTNHLFPPINLQFSSIPFPMQATHSTVVTPQFSLQHPNHHVLPKS